jgi:hypothetical protein
VYGAVLEHAPEDPVTEYVVVTEGETTMDVADDPVLQRYVLFSGLFTEAVKVVESP